MGFEPGASLGLPHSSICSLSALRTAEYRDLARGLSRTVRRCLNDPVYRHRYGEWL